MSFHFLRTKDLTCTRRSVTDSPPSSPSPTDKSFRHDRLSRFDSSGGNASYRLGRTSSYLRRETWFGSLNNQDQDTTSKDYKMMYAEALQENEHLKSRLQDSKQELVNIRFQLDKLAQDKEALEKRVSGMEEEMKVLTELKTDNQRLKDENGALIRVISKLSK
ncbi:protein phosphatase 1 regulatory subunit 12B isoform X7 [Stigmatopora nigra]